MCVRKIKNKTFYNCFDKALKNIIKIYKLFIIFLSIYLVHLFIVTVFVTNICCVQIETQIYIYIICRVIDCGHADGC